MADLQEDEGLINGYRRELKSGQWKKMCKQFRENGVLDYQIYLFNNRLFGVLETDLDFSLQNFAFRMYSTGQAREWIRRTGKYFKRIEGFEDSGRWVMTERVYKLNQKREYNMLGGYPAKRAPGPVRRTCDARRLVNEPAKIEKYKRLHAMGMAWPEITMGMIDAGVIDLEIYSAGNRTFEMTEVPAGADLEKIWAKIDNGPRSAEWGALVGPLDVPFVDKNGRPLENQLMERIFKLN
jgi:L-rhamnose mutarotase